MSSNRRLAVLALVPFLGACSWFTDFKQQPSVGTWQVFQADSAETKGFRGSPQGSIPTTGTVMAGYSVSYAPIPATIDSLSGIANPVPADSASLARGRIYYQMNCAVCHGDKGDGNGTLKALNPAYGFAPSLIGDGTKARTDGYIFGMLRNGRGLMAPVNRIAEQDRWHVVNYVRGLQGRYPVAIGPVGLPGQTAETWPGRNQFGPTRAVPHVMPTLNVVKKAAGEHGGDHATEPAPAAGEAKKTEGGH